MQRLTGLGASPGLALGRAIVFRHEACDLRYRILIEAVPRELGRLDRAREQTRQQLQTLRTRFVETAGPEHAYLFEAQLLMLDDPLLVPRAAQLIRQEQINAAWAVQRVFDELAAILARAEDPYLRERKGDIADLAGRVKANLRGEARTPAALLAGLDGPLVLVADTLPPSVAAQLDWTRVVGFVTDAGSRTSHTAILARSLGVPAVVGVHDASVRIAPGVTLILDGTSGEVTIDPPDVAGTGTRAWRDQQAAYERRLREYRDVPAVTEDGVTIRLDANIEFPEDVPRATDCGAEGIGLYRSEFLLARHPLEALTEDLQSDIYRHMLEQMAPGAVTIRTFDSRDRESRRDAATARGPQGLWVGDVTRTQLFTQLRALLRAAPHGRLRIMFPFVSGLESLREAMAVFDEARATLGAEGAQPRAVPVGVLIEIPSAALVADLLAREADFFSIGTNDLIQYALAVDRTDEQASRPYQPLHPAVLRLLRQVRRAGRRRRLPMSVCGEMAADPTLLPLLVGLGFTEFSMTPGAIPTAKQVLRTVRAADARALAAEVLVCGTPAEVEQHLTRWREARTGFITSAAQ